MAQKANWKSTMDDFIMENLTNAQIQVSYMSLDNARDQYHRNANLLTQSNSLIKLPIYLHALDQIEKGSLEIDEAYKLREERLSVNEQGMFSMDDAGRFVTTAQLLEAIAEFDDNAATNVLVNRLSRENIIEEFRNQKLNSLYLLKELSDHTKDETLNAGNFISVADLVTYQKRHILTFIDSRKGRQLLERYLLAFNQNKSFPVIDGTTLIEWKEDTQLAKGTSFIAYGPEKYVITIMISSFKDEGTALKLLEKAQQIFFQVSSS